MTHEHSAAWSPERRYFDALEDGRFDLPECRNCARAHLFPRLLCPYCGSAELRWIPASGRGSVYSTTVIRRTGVPPYNLALIDLEEGPRLMSQVVNADPNRVRIGAPVFLSEGRRDGRNPVFVLAEPDDDVPQGGAH